MDERDKALLNRIQADFPISPRPFADLGRELGMDEDQVLDRIRRLKREGIIRRIGGNFVPRKVGFVSTLCAARVPAHRVEDFTAAVNRYPGVTHNYVREGRFNVWFTFIAPSYAVIDANLSRIAAATGIDDIINLPATRVFKIKAHFDL